MASSTSLTRTVPHLLRQPVTIAALASVGIHGLLAANIEKISLFPSTVQLPPSVGLIELSPLQISRLYPPAPSKLSLSTIAPPPSLSTLGPSPTLPEFSPNLSTPSFPTFPTTPTAPTFPSASSNLPPINSYRYPLNNLPVSPIPSTPPAIPFPDSLPIFPQPQDRNGEELNRMRDRQLAIENLSPEDRAILENMQPEVYSSNLFSPSPGGEAEENYGIPPQRYANLEPEPEATPQAETPIEPENNPQGSLLATLQRDLNQNSSPPAPVSPPAETANTAQRTAMFEGGNAFVAWAGQLSQSYPNLEAKPPQTLSSFYPAAACPQQLAGQATVAVAMGTDGQVLDGPRLLSGTGHNLLDDAAVQKVEELATTQLGANVGSEPKAFWYAFDFNPDNCAAVEPASEATPQPPASVPEPEPVEETPPALEENTPTPRPEAEMTPVEPEPLVEPSPVETESEIEPPPVEMEPEAETPNPEAMEPEPEVENSSTLGESETVEETTSPTPTEHKGSLLESLTAPYVEPAE